MSRKVAINDRKTSSDRGSWESRGLGRSLCEHCRDSVVFVQKRL